MKLKGKAAERQRRAVKTKLGVLLYDCHAKGHTVHSQPASKRLLRINNSESAARYMLWGVLLHLTFSGYFVSVVSQIMYEKGREKSMNNFSVENWIFLPPSEQNL